MAPMRMLQVATANACNPGVLQRGATECATGLRQGLTDGLAC